MPLALFIDDVMSPHSCVEFESQTFKSSAKSLQQDLDAIDEVVTTDVGQSSASEGEAESSSGISSDEGSRPMGRHCRFGKTSLETIPATPTAASLSLNSPPGLSRAAMRLERDAITKEGSADVFEHDPSMTKSEADAVATSGVTLSRFGATPLSTVPKTPAGNSKLKNLQSVFGSPPGLSRAEKRRARDACKGWGSCGTALSHSSASGSASVTDPRSAAHRELAKMKERAAFLKDMTAGRDLSKNDGASDSCKFETRQDIGRAKIEVEETIVHGESSDVEPIFEVAEGFPQASAVKSWRCRFHGNELSTMPSTPVGQEATPSPPGLSRKAMRQARDSCRKTLSCAPSSWKMGNNAAFTISPAGKPMTPPAARVARQRAAKDARSFGLPTSMPHFPETYRKAQSALGDHVVEVQLSHLV